MASQNPGEPPINAPVTDDKGNMTVPWHLWCVMMWKKIGAGGALSLAWGSITGVLSAQADLVAAFAAKVTGNVAITGATHTKITYDSKGLVTAGSDLVAGDVPNIAESQVTGLGADLSALSTAIAGKQASLGFTPPPNTRLISTTAPLTGGGDLSADRTLAVSTMVGDSGAGGSRGVVPAPAAGDAAAGKFLKADGTFAVPPGTGGSGTVTHTGALDAHKVVIGNGTDDVKIIATGSAGQYLRSGGASADPAMASIAESEVTNLVSDLALKAPLASPTFTGDPKAPTASPGDNDTSIATTAFVAAAVAAGTFASPLTTKGDLYTHDTVDTRLGVGSDGQILIADSAQAKGIKWGNVSGASGSAAASGPYLVIGTNSYVFPMHSCALPDTSLTGFAWANQSNATAAAQSGALLITDLTTSAGTLHNLTKAIGTSTALIVAFIPTLSGVSANQQMGLTFLESGTGKMESLCVIARNLATATPGYVLDRWTGSGTGFNSNQFSTGCPTSPVVFLKLQVSGSNIIFSLSADGVNFIAVRTEAKTAYFTTAPDKWGYILAAGGTGSNINMLVVSWEES